MKKYMIKAIIHGSTKNEVVEAISKEEAIGRFLIKYPCNCYDNIKLVKEVMKIDIDSSLE